MKNRTKSDQHTQAHIEDLCLVRSKFEFSAGRGLFGQNNHSKEKKKKKNTIQISETAQNRFRANPKAERPIQNDQTTILSTPFASICQQF